MSTNGGELQCVRIMYFKIAVLCATALCEPVHKLILTVSRRPVPKRKMTGDLVRTSKTKHILAKLAKWLFYRFLSFRFVSKLRVSKVSRLILKGGSQFNATGGITARNYGPDR